MPLLPCLASTSGVNTRTLLYLSLGVSMLQVQVQDHLGLYEVQGQGKTKNSKSSNYIPTIFLLPKVFCLYFEFTSVIKTGVWDKVSMIFILC